MTERGRSLKTQAIVASVIGILTFFIFNIIVGIMILTNTDQFENKGLAIATGVCLLIFPFIIPLVLSCCLK